MRFVRAVVVIALVVLASVWLYARLTTDATPAAPTLGDSLRTFQTSASSKVRLSPDGTKLAVVQDGSLQVIRVRDAALVTKRGANVVDAAWMRDSARVVVTEGPIPTGELDVIGANGGVTAALHLSPSVGFGNGRGLAVSPLERSGAAIVVSRDAIGGAEHADLATVDFTSGAVRVYATPETDESSPVFVDEDTIALASRGPTGASHLVFVDVGTGAATDRGVIYDGPFVTTNLGDVVVGHRAANGAVRLVAVNPQGDDRQIAVLKPHRRPVAVDAHTTRVVVRVFGGEHGERLAIDPLV